jgi:hypothetical protein
MIKEREERGYMVTAATQPQPTIKLKIQAERKLE